MNARQTTSKLCTTPALLALVLPLVAGNAAAATYNLVATSFSKAMPDGTPVIMWGYAVNGGAPSAPGAVLVVPEGDTSLTVNLTNTLPEPTSLVISGQALPTDSLGAHLAPVKFPDGQGRQRVRSFTAEAAPGGTRSYTWNNLKPGTYLYHSGTHPQVQVQMGLYGAMTHDALPGQAYAGVAYHNAVTLVFSEVDPRLHAAVAAGRYGTPVPDPLPPGLTAADYPSSTIDYAPQYFLINGEDLSAPGLAQAAGSAGQATLLRLLNAGLQSRSPMLQGHYMRLVAEDGNPYPHPREQYATLLPALKTVDAVFTAPADTYPIYDRRLADGMRAFLTVAPAGGGIPLASNDAYILEEDPPAPGFTVAAPGVLVNDGAYTDDPVGTTASWLSGPSHGTVNLAADGSFTYMPAANYYGTDSFTYQAVNGGVSSLPATVSLTINPGNDPPVAADNAYSVAAGETLTVAAPGILGNDSDIDGDTLSAVDHSPLAGLTPNADGSFSYDATTATAGDYSFTYRASDGLLTSDPATVVITVTAAAPNAAPVAVKDTFSVARNSTGNILNVTANDSDPDGNLAPGTVEIVVAPNKGGTATENGDGTVSYTPRTNFRGSENFSYRVQDTGGLWSNTVTVKVNVK